MLNTVQVYADTLGTKRSGVVQVTVILKHMFTPTELEEEPALKDDLEVDVTTECAKVGAVDKVRRWSLWRLPLVVKSQIGLCPWPVRVCCFCAKCLLSLLNLYSGWCAGSGVPVPSRGRRQCEVQG